jgi:hypothetical protein
MQFGGGRVNDIASRSSSARTIMLAMAPCNRGALSPVGGRAARALGPRSRNCGAGRPMSTWDASTVIQRPRAAASILMPYAAGRPRVPPTSLPTHSCWGFPTGRSLLTPHANEHHGIWHLYQVAQCHAQRMPAYPFFRSRTQGRTTRQYRCAVHPRRQAPGCRDGRRRPGRLPDPSITPIPSATSGESR